MLCLKVELFPECWDAEKQEFVEPVFETLEMEHSLLSISKWESKWGKVFLSKDNKSYEETIDYYKCMTLNENVDPAVYDRLSDKNIKEIQDYIKSPMSATFFNNNKNNGVNKEPTTSELIYYWMVSFNIPFSCETWHLNRLLNLIRICGIKNESPKKMSKRDLMSRNSALNAQRRQMYNSKG